VFQKVEQVFYKNIMFVIRPTEYQDFDILALGSFQLLRQLALIEKFRFHLIKKSKFGGIPCIICDTADTLRGALSILKQYKELYNDTSGKVGKSHK
jgi:hypothetical protein